MSKKILLITDSYPPEIRSASHLMQDLAHGMVENGFEVTVATTRPQYNLSSSENNAGFPKDIHEGKIRVIRIWSLPHHKVNFVIRGISQLLMPLIFILRLLTSKVGKVDTVLVYSPPLPLAMVGFFAKHYYKAKFVFNVQDIFPQNAIDLGILKNRLAIKFFEMIESFAYKSADVVTVHSKSNADFLTKKNNSVKDKLMILHNWVDIEPFRARSKDNHYREKYNLQNKLVFLFAGIHGPSQGLDLLVEIADSLKGFSDVRFLCVGDGAEKDKIMAEVKKRGLNNIIFKDFVSKDEYPVLVRNFDIGLVSLSHKNKTPVVPGKILGYMAASKPVLALLNKESDAHNIIKDADCGYSAFSDDFEDSIRVCKKMIENRDNLSSLGENGFCYVRDNFERNICLRTLAEKL